MELKLTIFFLFLFSTFYSQNIAIDITDKSEEFHNNPAYNFKIIEPQSDTINLTNQRVFSLVFEYSGELNSFHIIDYPNETFAELNSLKPPETIEEYIALSDEEWLKFKLIVPKHEVLKEVLLSRRVILDLKIISERITHTELYADGKLIKTLYYLQE